MNQTKSHFHEIEQIILTFCLFMELQVQAIDLDVDNNAKIGYSIYESNGTRASDTFDINPSTGELFLKQNALALGIVLLEILYSEFLYFCFFYFSQRSVPVFRSSRRSRLAGIGHRSSSRRPNPRSARTSTHF